MKKKVLALMLSALLAMLGLTLVQSPASAHAGDISVEAACADADTVSATYTVGWSNGTQTGKLYQRSGIYGSQTGNNQDSTAGWSFVRDVTGKSGSASFTVTHEKSLFSGGNGPWWSSKVIFTDRYGVAADTRVERFDWSKCADTDTDSQSVTFCHATSSSVNPYNKLTTNVGAFYNAGHISHSGDIYPAGSFIKGGKNFSWPAQGDQSLLQFEDCLKPKPQQPQPIEEPLNDTKKDCTGLYERTGSRVTSWVWSTSDWAWHKAAPVDAWGAWVHVRDLAPAEKIELDCDRPDRPEPEQRMVPGAEAGCGLREIGGTLTWKDVYATDWKFDEGTFTWVKLKETGPERTDEVFTPYLDDEYFDNCAKDPETPEPVKTAWVDSDLVCGKATVTQTRSVETFAPVWNIGARAWEYESSTSTEIGARDLTPEEAEANLCPVPIDVPGQPGVADECGPGNIGWEVVPESTEQLTWAENEDGSLTATPIWPAVFKTEDKSVTFTLPEEPVDPCPTEKPDSVSKESSSTAYKCGNNFQTVTHTTVTTGWETEDNGVTWKESEPVSTSSTTTEGVQAVPCPAGTPEDGTPTAAPATPKAAGALPETGLDSNLIGASIVGLLLVGAGGAVLFTRRRRATS